MVVLMELFQEVIDKHQDLFIMRPDRGICVNKRHTTSTDGPDNNDNEELAEQIRSMFEALCAYLKKVQNNAWWEESKVIQIQSIVHDEVTKLLKNTENFNRKF